MYLFQISKSACLKFSNIFIWQYQSHLFRNIKSYCQKIESERVGQTQFWWCISWRLLEEESVSHDISSVARRSEHGRTTCTQHDLPECDQRVQIQRARSRAIVLEQTYLYSASVPDNFTWSKRNAFKGFSWGIDIWVKQWGTTLNQGRLKTWVSSVIW